MPSIPHWGNLVCHLCCYQTQVYLQIQFNILETNHQTCHIKSHQWDILKILALLCHMYKVGVHQELQVLFQALYQTQVQLLIQVKLEATNPQTFHLQSHKWKIMMILDLNHHMYQD